MVACEGGDGTMGVWRTFEDSDGGGEVVDAAGGLEGGSDDGRGRDEIVGEGVVEVALGIGVAG
jgi:hypothetical protein